MEEAFLLTTSILVFGVIPILVLTWIGMWGVFEKAGEVGWYAFIPVYNLVVLLRIVGKPWWWLLLYLIPGIGFIIRIMVLHLLSLSFSKGLLYTLGLYFFSPLFFILLGFRKSAEYIGPGGVA